MVFINSSPDPVKLFWMSPDGKPKFYAEMAKGQSQRQQTRPGAVWLIKSADGKPLGYFRVDDRSAKAVIPQSN